MDIKMKKPKKDKEKQDKMKAFMSFLETPAMTDSVVFQSQKKNNSDHQTYEEFVEDTNQCYICKENLDPVKKKKCAFCNMETCNTHLRKRRRINKKFQRICDYCEDKQLFDFYMKLQIKAEEALATQQQIISLKHNEYLSQVEKKRQKRNELVFKTQSIKFKYQEQLQFVKKKQAQIETQQRNLQKAEIQLSNLNQIVMRLGSVMKDNFQQDYNILLVQNQKLSKELINFQKRTQQVKKALDKAEKQITNAYDHWQKKQYLRNLERQTQIQASKKKGDCNIY